MLPIRAILQTPSRLAILNEAVTTGLLREPFSFCGGFMHRVAVFVDAGYLFAQGSALLSGQKLPRSQVVLNSEACVRALSEFARTICGVPLLRIYWYDGTSTGPTSQQLALAHLADVKLRLGFVNSVGEQKGVDSLIITDIIALARNRAISDAVLFSGDEDLRVGVQQAQEFGVRVHLLGIKPSRGSQSLALLQESDTTHEWEEGSVTTFLTCKRPATEPGGPAASVMANTASPDALGPDGAVAAAIQQPALEDKIGLAAAEVAARLELTDIAAVLDAFESSRQISPDVDRQLLGSSRTKLRRALESGEKKRLRQMFLDACRSRLTV